MYAAHFKNGDSVIFRENNDGDVKHFMNGFEGVEFRSSTGNPLFLNREHILYIEKRR